MRNILSKKRILSVLSAAALLLSIFPISLSAVAEVDPVPVPAPFTDIVNANDAGVEYDGNVTTQGNTKLLNDTKDSYEFVFSGTSFTLYGPVGQAMGMAEVHIDGILAGRIDAYATQASNEAVHFTSDALEAGLHRVTVVKMSINNEKVTAETTTVGFTKATIASAAAAAQTSLSLGGQWSIIKGAKTATSNSKQDTYDFDNAKPILVPGNIWEVFSDYIGNVWYGKVFGGYLSANENERVYLRFEAVQYISDVYLNGVKLGSHTGSYDEFEFDVTDILNENAENFLAVSVENVDAGYKIGVNPDSDARLDPGGIWQEVNLYKRPKVYISDVHAVPDWKTGDVKFDVTVVNEGSKADVNLSVDILDKSNGTVAATIPASAAEAKRGNTVVELNGNVKNFKLWDTENPNLYTVKVTVTSSYGSYTYKPFNMGFRHVEIKGGYFFLNGERFLMKMTHTGIGNSATLQITSRDISLAKKEIDQLKVGGFNTIRYLGQPTLPAVLDHADEVGILVYEESPLSLAGKNIYNDDLVDWWIIRDRNHPSIVAWGMLNEVVEGETSIRLTASRNYLPRLRTLDETRVVIWNSGRNDMNSQLASVANSYSSTWDVYLGGEDPNKPNGGYYYGGDLNTYVGDLHYYPEWPMPIYWLNIFRYIGKGGNTCMFTETGSAGMYNPFGDYRNQMAAGIDPNSYAMQSWVIPLMESTTAYYNKYPSLTQIYDSPEGLSLASQASALRQRQMLLTYTRANPKLSAISQVGTFDAGGIGEGIMDLFMNYKVGYEDMLKEAWAPLRWCLLFNNVNSNVERGGSLEIGVDLANEDVMAPGQYSAVFSVLDAAGQEVYNSGNVSFTIQSGELAPLAYEVWKKNIPVTWPEGVYTFKATLNSSEYTAFADEMTFYVSDNSSIVDADSRSVTVAGDMPVYIKQSLQSNGVDIRNYNANAEIDDEVILVFSGVDDDFWPSLYEKVAKGAYAVVLKADTLGKGYKWFPHATKPTVSKTSHGMVLYHNEWIVLPDDVLMKGLQTGVMDPAFWGERMSTDVRAEQMFMPTPDETNIASLYTTGLSFIGEGSDGVAMGTYNHYNGSMTISFLDIELGATTPAGERLLLNLVNYGHDKATAVTEIDEAAHTATLESFGFDVNQAYWSKVSQLTPIEAVKEDGSITAVVQGDSASVSTVDNLTGVSSQKMIKVDSATGAAITDNSFGLANSTMKQNLSFGGWNFDAQWMKSLSETNALVFYVKMPAAAADGFSHLYTSLTISWGADKGSSTKTWPQLVANEPYYILAKGSTEWTTCNAIGGTDIALPGGFEGYIRLPFTSFGLTAQDMQTAYMYEMNACFGAFGGEYGPAYIGNFFYANSVMSKDGARIGVEPVIKNLFTGAEMERSDVVGSDDDYDPSDDLIEEPEKNANLIVNGSFENGGEGWDLANPVQGQASNGAWAHYAETDSFYCIEQTVTVEPDTYYLVSGDIYLVKSLGTTGIGIDINRYEDWFQSLVNPSLDGVARYGEWVSQSKLWYSGSNTTAVVRISIEGCAAYVDNVRMIKQTAANGSFQNVGSTWQVMSFEYSTDKVYTELTLPESIGANTYPASYSAKASGVGMRYGVQWINIKPNTYYYLSAAFYRTADDKAVFVQLGDIGQDDIYVISQSTGKWETQSLVWYSGSFSGAATLKLFAEDMQGKTASGEYYIDNVLLYEYVPEGAYVDKTFAGWYTDEALTVSHFGMSDFSARVYPKWTDDQVLTVQAQITNGTTARSESTNMRLVSTVDSLMYAEVGFEIKIGDGAAKKYSTNTVYDRINGAGDSYLPSVFSQDSQHFFAFNIRNIPQNSFDTLIVVTPYWRTLDGTTVYGTTRTLAVSALL